MKETEQARTRRRWITLGEVVGILALVISGLSYWDAHQDRVAPPKPVAVVQAKAVPLVLTGTLDAARDRIDLHPATGGQVIQTQTIRFPTTVRADAVDTTGNARIEAAWFETGLRTALKGAKLHDNGRDRAAARHRLAVGIETTFVDGDATRTDRAIYDLGYSLHGRVLRPDVVTIEGVGLVRHVGGNLQAAIDARFAGQVPAAGASAAAAE